MTIEQSHGKARPMLPRAGDLQKLPDGAEGKRPDGRTPDGRFAPGNRGGKGARFKRALRKILGDRAGGEVVAVVAGDARRVFSHVLTALPSDAAPVRVLVTIHARHVALHGYYTMLAEAKGLDTPEGMKLLEIADRQSQRAERTLVTALDCARVCAQREEDRRGMHDPLAAYRVDPT